MCVVALARPYSPTLGVGMQQQPADRSALSTENLVAASKHMARYKKLTAPEEIFVELDGEEFTVGFRWLLAVDAEP